MRDGAAPGSFARPAGSPVLLGLLAFWTALWVVVGGWTGHEVWQLADLSRTVAASGEALDEAGTALQGLEPVPLVGERSAEIGSEVRATAARVVDSAGRAASSVRRLSVLLGLAIALIPTVPVLALYLAARSRTGWPRTPVPAAGRPSRP